MLLMEKPILQLLKNSKILTNFQSYIFKVFRIGYQFFSSRNVDAHVAGVFKWWARNSTIIILKC